jgi:hypothetical protein
MALHLLALAVAFPTALYSLGVLGWIVGVPIHPALIAVALGACVATLCALHRSDIQRVLAATVVFCIFVALAVALSMQVVDRFFDSQSYHLPATIALSQGWNPIAEPAACDWSQTLCIPTQKNINHYPKAPWVVSATLYQLTGSFEAGKAAQLIALLAAWIATARLLRGFAFFGPAAAVGLSALVALNPIAIRQTTSAYVDGWFGSALLLFGALLLDFVFHRRRSSLVLAALSLPFLINLKFTALPFAGLLALAAMAIAWRVRREALRPMLAGLCAAGTLGVLLLGFHPYVSNAIAKQNPFYPLSSKILDRMTSPEFTARDRFSKFAISHTSHGWGEDFREPQWIVPFSGWRPAGSVDDRFSGFGEPFAAALLLSIVALAFAGGELVWILVLGVVASLFVSEAAWWARLAPQAWWLPGLAVIACWLPPRRSVARALGLGIAGILVYTIVATVSDTTVQGLHSGEPFERALERLEHSPAVIVPEQKFGPIRGSFSFTLRQRLRDAGHDVRVVRRRPCDSGLPFEGASLCFEGEDPPPSVPPRP